MITASIIILSRQKIAQKKKLQIWKIGYNERES